MPALYHRDHENFGKSTAIFIQTFILLSSWEETTTFVENFVSQLFNNCFPFSIKIQVKYNTILLVLKWQNFRDFASIFKNQHWNLILKGTTMEIEKTLKKVC